MSFTIGVISDTHGLLRPEAVSILKTCDAIAHAGDIGAEEVLIALRAMAPIYAVRGNVDWGPWAVNIPVYEFVELSGCVFYITHILENMDLDPKAAGVNVVISGHSHQPGFFKKGNVLYMNPGSAGPGRFTRPISMGKIVIDDEGFHPEIIKLI